MYSRPARSGASSAATFGYWPLSWAIAAVLGPGSTSISPFMKADSWVVGSVMKVTVMLSRYGWPSIQ